MKFLQTKNQKLIALGLVVVLVGAGAAAAVTLSKKSNSAAAVKPLSITAAPTGMIGGTAPTPTGDLFVLVNSNGKANVQLLNPTSKTPLSTFPVSNAATGIASNGSSTIAISQGNLNTGSVAFYTAVSHKLFNTVPLPGPAIGMQSGPNPSLFYALVQVNNNDSLAVVSPSSRQVQTSIPMPAGTTSFGVSADGSTIYALQGNGTVSLIGLTSGKVQSAFSVGSGARSLALSQDNSRIYVLKGSPVNDNVSVVDVAKQSVKYVLPAPAYAVQIQVAPNNTELYDIVGNPSFGNIQIFPTNA